MNVKLQCYFRREPLHEWMIISERLAEILLWVNVSLLVFNDGRIVKTERIADRKQPACLFTLLRHRRATLRCKVHSHRAK